MFPPRPGRWSLCWLFLFVLVSLLVVSGATGSWDASALRWVATFRTPAFTHVMQATSGIGNWEGEIPFLLLVAWLLWRRNRRREASALVAAAATGELLYAALKWVFHRPRPEIVSHLSGANWYSYPSGHAMLAPIIWGYGLLLLSTLVMSRAAASLCRIMAVVMVLAIALARVYLGVHYPTDVIGGVCAGLGWVLAWRIVAAGPPVRS